MISRTIFDSCVKNFDISQPHLEPLGAVVVRCCPSVSLALFVQASVEGIPGKGIYSPGAEAARCCKLHIRDETGFHAQRIGATNCAGVHCQVRENESAK